MDLKTKYVRALDRAISEHRQHMLIALNAIATDTTTKRPKVTLKEINPDVPENQQRATVTCIEITHCDQNKLLVSFFDIELPRHDDVPFPSFILYCKWRSNCNDGNVTRFLYLTDEEKERALPDTTKTLKDHLTTLEEIIRPYLVPLYE